MGFVFFALTYIMNWQLQLAQIVSLPTRFLSRNISESKCLGYGVLASIIREDVGSILTKIQNTKEEFESNPNSPQDTVYIYTLLYCAHFHHILYRKDSALTSCAIDELHRKIIHLVRFLGRTIMTHS